MSEIYRLKEAILHNGDRKIIAAMLLQGLLSNPDYNSPSYPKKLPTVDNFAKCAVGYTDALLAELEKQPAPDSENEKMD